MDSPSASELGYSVESIIFHGRWINTCMAVCMHDETAQSKNEHALELLSSLAVSGLLRRRTKLVS